MDHQEDCDAAYKAASTPSRRILSAVLGGMGFGIVTSVLGGAGYAMAVHSAVRGVTFMRRTFPLTGAAGLAINFPTIRDALEKLSKDKEEREGEWAGQEQELPGSSVNGDARGSASEMKETLRKLREEERRSGVDMSNEKQELKRRIKELVTGR
eukprot:768264-Hanusia_phi.AAC.3